MYTVVIDKDRHRLVVDEHGAIHIHDDSSFEVYDTITECFVRIPKEALNAALALLLEQPAILKPVSSSSETESSCTTTDETTHSISSSASPSPEIWVKNSGKPSTLDLRARDDLIALVKSEKYQSLLKDKKTTKKYVSEDIAKELVKKGYSFGEREGWKVCQQKWKNMEAETLRVVAAAGPKNSGGCQVRKPSYYEDVFDVLKDTAKASPKNLQDSFPDEEVTSKKSADGSEAKSDCDSPFVEEEETASSSKTADSPFLKVKTSAKPKQKVHNEDILNFLKEDAAEKKKQTDKLLRIFEKRSKKDDKNNKALLNVLQDIAGRKRKKPAGDPSSNSSSSSSSASEQE